MEVISLLMNGRICFKKSSSTVGETCGVVYRIGVQNYMQEEKTSPDNFAIYFKNEVFFLFKKRSSHFFKNDGVL